MHLENHLRFPIMIVQRSMNRARPVFVMNSRLPVYKLKHGNGIGDVVTSLFTRVAPKLLPVGKEIASKGIGVLSNKVGTELGNLAVRGLDAATGKIAAMVRKNPKNPKLTSTYNMPPKTGSAINKIVRDRLRLISGSGLKRLII